MLSLEDFKVTPGKSFVLKKLLPKIKIHNLDSLKFDHNENMTKAILEKNIELRLVLKIVKKVSLNYYSLLKIKMVHRTMQC